MGAPAPVAMSSGTILVVDDSDVMLQIVSSNLDAAGWRAQLADSIPAAIEQLKHHRFDAVICDLHMPEGGGLEFLRRARAVDETLPVVVLSSDGDVKAILASVREGAFDYVQKGDDYAPLMAAIERAANHARISRENRDLAEKLKEANRALENRTQVLARQADALLAQHHEVGEKNRELEAASTRKSELLARIDFELRGPLQTIAGMGALVLEEEASRIGVGGKTRVEKIVSSAWRMMAALEDLRNLSKIETGVMDFASEDVDIHALLDGAENTARLALDGKPVATVRRADAHLPLLRTDRAKLVHVLQSLVLHACDTTPTGTIAIAASTVAGRRSGDADRLLLLSIHDSGPGYAGHEVTALFDELKGSVDPDRESSVSGFGLPLAKQMVHRLGGELSIQSTKGKGTIVTVSLPLIR